MSKKQQSKRVALTTKTLCTARAWDLNCPFCDNAGKFCRKYLEFLELTASESPKLKRIPQCLKDFPGIIVMTAMEDR